MHQLTDEQLADLIKATIAQAFKIGKPARATDKDSIASPPPPPPIEPLLTLAQMIGIFQKDRQAIMKMDIDRVQIAPGQYRWKPADVREFIENNTEKSEA